MRFLLAAVNAKYIHSNPAVYSLRAYAGKKLRPHIDLAEYTINQQPSDILADIYGRKPDVIGFSCYIWNWNVIRELIPELAKVLPRTDIWLGGPEVSFDAARVLAQFPQLTGVMVGEGEATFRELLEWYVSREEGAAGTSTPAGTQGALVPEKTVCAAALADIPGLCLRGGAEGACYTPERPLLELSEIPFPYDDPEPFANRIIYYETSRGCPYRCSYCLSSIDKRVRLRDLELVRKELQFFLDNRVKQVKFVDRTFNCDHAHAMAIWQYILEHDNGVTNFHFEISADILREDEIELLSRMRPGLAQLEIGVQSANPQAIEAVCRVMDLERLEERVAAIREGGNIHQHLDLIAGLPYEDYESFGRSFDRVYAMKPEQLQLGFLKVLKGSAMQEKAEEYGICYRSQPPYEVLYTNWLSYEEVLRLKKVEEMVELYYNSGQFTHTLAFLERAFETPFAMFEAMAAFYEERGYFLQNPARIYRYQVLLTFAQAYDPAYAEVYRELLTFDLYLRENMKSRPEFCRDKEEVTCMSQGERVTGKEFERRFYRAEEQERRYLPAYAAYDWKQMSKMTHMEVFTYPVWDAEKLSGCRSGEAVGHAGPGEAKERGKAGTGAEDREWYFVVFDYLARSPLNQEAAYFVISARAGMERKETEKRHRT